MLIVSGIVVLAVVLISFSLRRPELPTYPPSALAPSPAGERKVGPVLYTLDASSDGWTYFDFSVGSVVRSPSHLDWDVAFNRFRVIANGGEGFSGQGGVVDLGELPFDSVSAVPEHGYVETIARNDSSNAAIERWYDYGFTSHLLEPKPRVYGIRTADGRYAKLQMVGYYCPGAVPGCVTFRYVYQGSGSREVSSGA